MSITQRSRERISRPYDARAVRSREALRQALLELIDVKPLDQISIRDITLRANLSYPVFFRQFASREELFEDVAAEEVRILLQLSESAVERQSEPVAAELCHYVAEHRKMWSTLLTAGAHSQMRSEFSRLVMETTEIRRRVNPAFPVELLAEITANMMFDILTWWLRQPEDYPIGNVIKLINALVVRIHVQPADIELE